MALTFTLSSGQAHDAPEGRKLLTGRHRRPEQMPMVMDRAYEGDAVLGTTRKHYIQAQGVTAHRRIQETIAARRRTAALRR